MRKAVPQQGCPGGAAPGWHGLTRMGAMIETLYEPQAELFRVIGHPVRLRVLELLCERDHSVPEMLAELAIDAGSLAAELGALRHHRLISQQRTGSEVAYSLLTPSIAQVLTGGRRVLHESLAEAESLRLDARHDDRA